MRSGTSPVSTTAVMGIEALSLLHTMGSASASASAALKLLHEFQVHQVELDMQHEHLQRSSCELNRALESYVERFDDAPVAYLVLNRDGQITEGNVAAAELFSLEREAICGQRIDRLVTAEHRLMLLGLLKRLSAGSAKETCEAMVRKLDGEHQKVTIVARTAQRDAAIMMVINTV